MSSEVNSVQSKREPELMGQPGDNPGAFRAALLVRVVMAGAVVVLIGGLVPATW